MHLRDAVALSLIPRRSRLRQPVQSGATSALAQAFDELDACERSGASSDRVFTRLLAVLEAECEPSAALAALRARADEALDRARRAGVHAWAARGDRFPASLASIYDPPPVLWGRGALSMPVNPPAVAIVGSRTASSYALEVARRLGSELAGRGVIVVSGLARGVDSAAHRGAIAAGGLTVAVLGCGADRVYPPEHRQLAADITAQGLLVSEFPPGTPPRAHHFPLRNRIISGLSLAVVVVEASEKSGSLITAACAAEQGRDVMAVPGNVLSGRNRGSHALLKDGAKIVESSDDILEELGLAARPTSARVIATALDDTVLHAMAMGEAYELDDLVAATGLDGSRLLARLAELELSGRVGRADGGRFVRRAGAVL